MAFAAATYGLLPQQGRIRTFGRACCNEMPNRAAAETDEGGTLWFVGETRSDRVVLACSLHGCAIVRIRSRLRWGGLCLGY
jgi:hypothetical protein